MFYATQDEDRGKIDRKAEIVGFETEEEMRDYLLSPYDPRGWRHEDGVIGPGRFVDCWFEFVVNPVGPLADLLTGPFAADEIAVNKLAGIYRVTPRVPVNVLLSLPPRTR